MNEDEKRSLIERYLASYNAFDIDGMMAVIHPDIEFKNVSGGEVNATASGSDEFRQSWLAVAQAIPLSRSAPEDFPTEGLSLGRGCLNRVGRDHKLVGHTWVRRNKAGTRGVVLDTDGN